MYLKLKHGKDDGYLPTPLLVTVWNGKEDTYGFTLYWKMDEDAYNCLLVLH